MPTTWHSLYLQNDDSSAVVTALVDTLQSLGYQRYDPFPGGMGTPPGLKTFAKYFVTPSQHGWVRILGEPAPDLLPALSQKHLLLYAWLTDSASGVEVYSDGERHDERLHEFLRLGASLPDDASTYDENTSAENSAGNVALPDDIQRLAQTHNVNPDQANKLVSRLTSQLFGKLDRTSGGEASAMQDQARAMVSGGGAVNWNSVPAQRLKAILDTLTVPSNWRDPDFDSLRDAYQVARRLRRTPSAQLMPDEQAAIKAIPNAIEYEAVYMGK